jgi:hypothetical protein
MTWSGRDALLAEFQPRFHDQRLLAESLAEYVKSSRVLDDQRARQWLQQDLVRDVELAAIEQSAQVDALPRPSLYALGGCFHCYGRGVVRKPAEAGHPDFGKAFPCPACLGGTAANPGKHCENCEKFVASSLTLASRNQCWKCRQFEDERAGPYCSNPKWHLPNWQSGEYPKPTTADELGEQWRSA